MNEDAGLNKTQATFSGWNPAWPMPKYTVEEIPFTEEEYQKAFKFKRKLKALQKRIDKLEQEFQMTESNDFDDNGIKLVEEKHKFLILRRHRNKEYDFTNRYKRVPFKFKVTYEDD